MSDKTRTDLIRDLLGRFKTLDAAGAGKTGHPDCERRSQLLDELQDASGLAGRMVMERDIVKKAERLLADAAR